MAMLDLNSFDPEQRGQNSKFVSEQNNRKHIGNNPNHLHCRRYKVDDYIMSAQSGKKCDYLLVNDDGKDAYFIELKGSNIDDAPKQIDATIEALKDSLPDYFFFRRIVCSKANTHKINGSIITSWKKKHNGKHHDQKAVRIKETTLIDTMTR